ncbi:hypothetical protein VTO73DRAFT_10435 [Trametes versicolor]
MNASASAFREVKEQIFDYFDTSPEVESRWAHHVAMYEDIIDDSQTTATRISAIVRMYTGLQVAFTEAKPEDIIHELSTLKKALLNFDDSLAPRLDALTDAIRQFLSEPEITRASRRVTGGPLVNISRTGWMGVTSSALQAVGYHFLWTPLLQVGGLLAPETATTTARRCGNGSGFMPACNNEAASAQDAVANIRHILREVEAHKQMFDVFQLISRELMSEFDRHSAALEAARDKPMTPEAADIIQRAHADATSQAGQWKNLARVLVDEYARA